MTRLLIILFFLTANLFSQQTNWQSYVYVYGFNVGIDMGETLWMSTFNSIIKYDKGSDKPEIISIKDIGINFSLRDMHKGRNGQIYFLGVQDDKIVEMKDGVFVDWPTDPLFTEHMPYDILGETVDGALLIRTRTDRVIRFDKEQGASFVENIPSGLDGRVRDGYISNDGQLLLWGYRQIAILNGQGELVEDINYDDEFIYQVKMDEDGFVWIVTSVNIRYWSPETGVWSILNIEDMAGFYPNKIYILSDHSAMMLSNVNELIAVSYNDDAFEWENVDMSLFNNDFPAYSSFVDDEDRFWYMNDKNHRLTYWEIGHSPVAIDGQPWLSTYGVNAISQDKQGKIWVGGYYHIAYLFGGEWNPFEVSDPLTTFGTGSINEIEFTSDNRPVVGIGSVGFFGGLPSFVLEWNGQVWDTLHQAVLGLSTFPVMDLEIDKDDNLWVIRDFDNILSVRSYGEWIRFKTSDTPLDASVFTFIKEGPEGKIWIGTDKGIVTYDGYRFSSIDSTALSLSTSIPEDILFDDKGQIWVATSNDGIRKWNGMEWEILRPAQDLSLSTTMKEIIQGVGDELWVRLDWDGVLHFDGQEWEHITPLNSGLVESQISSIMKDNQDRIWFASQGAVSVLHPKEHTIIPFELSPVTKLAVYPNPGCCFFRVHWFLDNIADTKVRLMNVAGQILQEWPFEKQDKGAHQLDIKQGGLPSGTYFIQLYIDQKPIETVPLIIVD